jgi:type IV pilus assembly protein PilW
MLIQSRRRGLSIVELLVGVAIGLIVAQGAVNLFVRNITASRRLLYETRLNQDLRAAADLVARDLRRAGYWGNAIQGTNAVGATAITAQNPYSAVDATTATQITYEFSRDGAENDTLDGAEQFGFRLSGGALQMQIANGSWTDITNSQALTITGFTVTPTTTTLPLGNLCYKPCGVGTPNCPTVTVRSYAILLRGQAVADSNIRRDLRSTVRMRNDQLAGACPI